MGHIKRGDLKIKLRNTKTDTSRIFRQHTCEFCGELFLSARTTAKYCNNACKQKAYRKNRTVTPILHNL